MNLDDLLKSIREEDDDSKGGKINAENFKTKTFKNPLIGQSFKAPGLPTERPVVIKVEPDKLIPKDEDTSKEILEKLDELIDVIKKDNELEKKEQDYDRKKDAREKRQKREKRIEVGKIFSNARSGIKKAIGGLQSVFDTVIRFLAFTLLGQIVKFVTDFLGDPKNKKFLEDAQNFIRGIPDKLREVRDKLIPVIDWFKEQGPKIAKFAEDFRKLLAKFPFLGQYFATEKEKQQGIPTVPGTTMKPGGFPLPNVGPGGIPMFIPFATGGLAMGTDTVPAMLTPGEFVMSRGAVSMFGADTMMAMNKAGGGTNRPKFGLVSGYQSGGFVISPEERSMLDAISAAEGTTKSYGTVYGGKVVPELARGEMTIQEVLNMMKSGMYNGKKLFATDKYNSDATGRYQFMSYTLKEEAEKAGLNFATTKFTPDLQDELILRRIRRMRGVTPELLRKEGMSDLVIDKLAPEFASFPNLFGPDHKGRDIQGTSFYGQGGKSADFIKDLYNKSSGMKMSPTPPPVLPPPGLPSGTGKSVDDRFDGFDLDFIFKPIRQFFGVDTPYAPTSSKIIVLPPIKQQAKQPTKTQISNEIPDFRISSGVQMRDLVGQSLGIEDLVERA